MNTPLALHDNFTIERQLPFTPAKVFAAWSNDTVRKRWFVEGEGWVTINYRFDFRTGASEGGKFRREDSSNVISNDTYYQDIIENRRIVFAYTMRVDDAPMSSSLVTVEFLAEGKGTRLIVTEHVALLDGSGKQAVADRKGGWEWLLGRMADEVAAAG